MTQRRLILITGMAGSGKTTLAQMMKQKGYRVLTMGDVIRSEVKLRGLPPTPENLGEMAKEIREHGGDAAVAKKCIPLIIGEVNKLVAVDGIRSLDEVYVFEEAFDIILVAVHASPETRFQRLRNRGRSDDPKVRAHLRIRDHRELGFGMGNAIALADLVIINENGLIDLENGLDTILERIKHIDKD
jgi:dephospho-CoA kinase